MGSTPYVGKDVPLQYRYVLERSTRAPRTHPHGQLLPFTGSKSTIPSRPLIGTSELRLAEIWTKTKSQEAFILGFIKFS